MGGVNCIQHFFGFLDFFLYLQGPLGPNARTTPIPKDKHK